MRPQKFSLGLSHINIGKVFISMEDFPKLMNKTMIVTGFCVVTHLAFVFRSFEP